MEDVEKMRQYHTLIKEAIESARRKIVRLQLKQRELSEEIDSYQTIIIHLESKLSNESEAGLIENGK